MKKMKIVRSMMELKVGDIVTLREHPQYKGLMGEALTVIAVDEPFVIVEHVSTLGSKVKTTLDRRESEFMPLTNDYVKAASHEANPK